MGLLDIFSGAGGLVKGIASIADEFVTTDEERMRSELSAKKLDLEFEKVAQAEALAQIAVNKKEAEHKSIFVAGWRPFVGWSCAMCMNLFVLASIAYYMGWLNTDIPLSQLAVIWSSVVAPIFLGILGIRAFEKTKGVARKSLSRE